MITADSLGTQVGARLSNVKRLSGGAIRGERNDYAGNPYAIYYFALSNDLKDWAEHLEQRLDELIGPSYFETPGDLRWNHYLYLVVDSDGAANASFADHKRQIELDRSYARKFVLKQDELPAALKELEPSLEQQTEVVGPDVVGRWTDRLLTAQLGVILDQLPITETIRAIAKGLKGKQPLRADRDRKQRGVQPLATKFIDAIELVQFRNWPKKQLFDSLGTVNLIVGSNGVGKTTLLEAIEYAYCQENARTASPKAAHVRVRLKDSATWLDTKAPSKAADAKQRNLDWYGQRDLKGSTLSNSFSRFNFLATDDAAMLGQRNAKLTFEDMLSRLVAGPQAAELWDHISRLEQPLVSELSRAQRSLYEANQRKVAIAALIESAAAAPRASDSDLSALAEDLQRLRWKKDISRETITSSDVPALTLASSIVRELRAAHLELEPVSPAAVSKSLEAANSILSLADELDAQIGQVDAKVHSANVARDKLQQTMEDIKAIQHAQQMGAFRAVEELERLEQQLIALRSAIGGDPIPIDSPSWVGIADGPLSEEFSSAVKQSDELEKQILRLNEELSAGRAAQESTASLIADLRALTKHLLAMEPSHKDCPVCLTPFDQGQLAQRLEATASGLQTDRTAPILRALEIAKLNRSQLESRRLTLSYLRTYAVRRGFAETSISARFAFLDYQTQRGVFEEARRSFSDLSQQLTALTLSGLDRKKTTALRQFASEMSIDALRADSTDAALAKRAEQVKNVETELRKLAIEREKVTSELYSTLLGDIESPAAIDRVLNDWRDRRRLLRNASTLIKKLQGFLVLDDDDDVTVIGPRIDSAKEVAERFAAAIATESASRTSEAAATEQLAQVEEQIKEFEATEKRLRLASDELSELRTGEALGDATDAELLSVQAATDSVFRKIHSPHEYGVRRDAQAPLFPLDDPSKAITLRDISTGQRAAFVLSVFLAMNAKLQTAPPVLLFDDPVAHVDDFNSLSFLDHLRDLALEGRRQVFYATADVRLAGLMEHKLSFLGDKFRRFDLVR